LSRVVVRRRDEEVVVATEVARDADAAVALEATPPSRISATSVPASA
jgi:hypothetical protein